MLNVFLKQYLCCCSFQNQTSPFVCSSFVPSPLSPFTCSAQMISLRMQLASHPPSQWVQVFPSLPHLLLEKKTKNLYSCWFLIFHWGTNGRILSAQLISRASLRDSGSPQVHRSRLTWDSPLSSTRCSVTMVRLCSGALVLLQTGRLLLTLLTVITAVSSDLIKKSLNVKRKKITRLLPKLHPFF